MQLWLMRNKKGSEYVIVIDTNWSSEEMHSVFLAQGVDLTYYNLVNRLKLFDGDLDVQPGDWWKR